MLARLDQLIMFRAFWPAALWLDRWFHLNNYRAAKWCVIAFAALFDIRVAVRLTWDGYGDGPFKVDALDLIFLVVINLVVRSVARTMDRCAKAAERNPGAIPQEAMSYAEAAGSRLFAVIWTTIFAPPDAIMIWGHYPMWLAPICILAQQSLLAYAGFRYFAALPPTTGRPRHKWSFSLDLGMAPAPSPI